MKNILFLLMTICAIDMVAQDIQLSQFTATPLNLNPALAGNNTCDWRVVANVRNEWLNLSNKFMIGSISGDIAIGRIKNKKQNFLGAGLVVNMDKAGTLNFLRTEILPTVAYHMMLGVDGKTTLSFGLQGGVRIMSLSPDPNSTITVPTKVIPDASFGILFNQKFSELHNFYIGSALFHLPQPSYTLIDRNVGTKWYLKYQANIGGQFGITKSLFIMPSFQYNTQQASTFIKYGSYIKYKLTNESKSKNTPMSVYIGGWYSNIKTLTTAVRFDYDNLNIAFSYDLNFNPIQINGLPQAPELSIIYTGCLKKNNNKFGCPSF